MAEKSQAVVIDKSQWPDGPWKTEPDRLQWQRAGYACLMVRHAELGHWCGYVGVDRSHPYYGQPYDDCDVRVHGGLTYAAKCAGRICHVPEPGMPEDVWWLGFDCGHHHDLAPGMQKMYSHAPALERYAARHLEEDAYRDLAYVKAETEALANQLRELAPVPSR